MCIRCLVAKGVSRDARNMEGHIRNAGTPGSGADTPPFLVAQWSVVGVEGRDVSRQGNVVRSNQSGVPSPSSPLDCSIGRMFPVSPTILTQMSSAIAVSYNFVQFPIPPCLREKIAARAK